MRIHSIDFIKGLLITLVIVGHTLPGTLEESFLRHAIYSFHMPLFAGISGYMLNVDWYEKSNLKELANKNFPRLLTPWLFAVLIYLILSIFSGNSELSIKTLCRSLIHPYFHLWFIPSYLSWIFYGWVVLRFKFNLKLILILSAGISLISFSIKLYPNFSGATKIVEIIQYTLRPYLLIFFVIGILMKSSSFGFGRLTHFFSLLLFILSSLAFFYKTNFSDQLIIFFGLNISLLFSFKMVVSNNNFPTNKFLQWIGQNSLAVYLWHMIPLLFVRMVLVSGSVMFFIVVLIAQLAFLLIYYYLIKVDFFRKYVFGMKNS